MSEQRFDVLFSGELLPGFSEATVAENLAKLFKATPETVARLMAGGNHALKRNADRETALKYQAAMDRAGARATLRPVAGETPGAPVAAAPPVPSELTVAASGGELLAAHERREQAAIDVDTSHIKLVSSFGPAPEDDRPPPPSPPDTAHISVADAGADLLPERPAQTPPPPPDTSAITLAEAGSDLGPAPQPQLITTPDISHISLAPPGAPLDELRPERKPLVPDTSAFELAPRG